MTSTIIYKEITPTYLYIKQHSVTGLKYFGKTTKEDPIKYLGSGKYWTTHINKHGKEFVETIWLSDLYYDTSIVEYALHFSQENKIVESDNWANLKSENGLDGGKFIHSVETKSKMSASHTGVPRSDETKANISLGKTGTTRTDSQKEYFSKVQKVMFVSIIETKKTYNKSNTSRYYPELRPFF